MQKRQNVRKLFTCKAKHDGRDEKWNQSRGRGARGGGRSEAAFAARQRSPDEQQSVATVMVPGPIPTASHCVNPDLRAWQELEKQGMSNRSKRFREIRLLPGICVSKSMM